MKSLKDSQLYIRTELKDLYPEGEIHSFERIIFEHLLDLAPAEIVLKSSEPIEANIILQIKDIVSELKNFRPIQYILGETEFYELKFKVDDNVLIPRGETEELVHLIINENADSDISILDIGTGSGCIPVSLAKNMPAAKVFGCDISVGAINVARKNAELNKAKVEFFNYDILTFEDNPFDNRFDIIVSNPPYIRNSEKQLMENNVLDFEPHLALFVSDSDPLIFYRRIAEFGLKYLERPGKLYYEINEAFGNETADLLNDLGYVNTRVVKDLHGRDRIVVGELYE